MPVLELASGDIKGGATRAVMRFLSHRLGYYPEDNMQAQQCDMICDYFQDIFDACATAAWGKGSDPATIPEARTKYWAKLTEFLTFLDPYCAKGEWLCGSKPCTADFWVGAMICS